MPQRKAKELLDILRRLAYQGLEECWPVPPESGWALAKAQKETPEKSTKIFKQKWMGEFKMEGEREKAEMKLCFGTNTDATIFLENKTFHKALDLLYGPIIYNLIT